MSEPTLFIATPLHDGNVHHLYLAGALQAMSAFPGRVRFDAVVSSFLPKSRDTLTSRFLASGASHMLCVDSDIGWTPAHVEALLATEKPFISGVYAMKRKDRQVPALVIEEREGLLRCEYVPGGFLLLSRDAVLAMADRYAHLAYESGGIVQTALWLPVLENGSYGSEDISFCHRWTAMGGEIWMHPGCVLKHAGAAVYEPDGELNLQWRSQTT
jgi:hypothetical protein